MRTKVFLLAVAAAATGVMVSRRSASRRAEHALWTEATDPVDLR
ncbi:MAG: hypothetical protein QOE76_1203 [Frankiales bacterium]|jgi:hypothetical protein|nr:hypothetical protein [Frankiales bacterium]